MSTPSLPRKIKPRPGRPRKDVDCSPSAIRAGKQLQIETMIERKIPVVSAPDSPPPLEPATPGNSACPLAPSPIAMGSTMASSRGYGERGPHVKSEPVKLADPHAECSARWDGLMEQFNSLEAELADSTKALETERAIRRKLCRKDGRTPGDDQDSGHTVWAQGGISVMTAGRKQSDSSSALSTRPRLPNGSVRSEWFRN